MNRNKLELIQDGMYGGLKTFRGTVYAPKPYCGDAAVPAGRYRGRPSTCFAIGRKSGFAAGVQAGSKQGYAKSKITKAINERTINSKIKEAKLEGIAKGTRVGAAIKKRKVEKTGLPPTLKPSDITPNVRSDFLRPFIAELNKQNLYEPIFKRLIRRGELQGPYRVYGKSSLDERKAILQAYFRTTGKSKFVL